MRPIFCTQHAKHYLEIVIYLSQLLFLWLQYVFLFDFHLSPLWKKISFVLQKRIFFLIGRKLFLWDLTDPQIRLNSFLIFSSSTFDWFYDKFRNRLCLDCIQYRDYTKQHHALAPSQTINSKSVVQCAFIRCNIYRFAKNSIISLTTQKSKKDERRIVYTDKPHMTNYPYPTKNFKSRYKITGD